MIKRPTQLLCFGIALLAGLQLISSAVLAQERQLPKVNYLLDARQAPGEIGAAQILRGSPGVGSYQAVSIRGPEPLKVALVQNAQFLEPLEAPVTTGMLVGSVYRFRVTGIPFHPGEELYPTVEIIDRLYAPVGREHRFPIPVLLTQEDMNSALDGALVTRVIYVEDSEVAQPISIEKGEQLTTDVGPSENALQVADQLGRPVAILRIGSRVPASLHDDLTHFTYGSPPWIPLPTVPDKQKLIDQGQWPETVPVEPSDQPFPEQVLQDYPRVP